MFGGRFGVSETARQTACAQYYGGFFLQIKELPKNRKKQVSIQAVLRRISGFQFFCIFQQRNFIAFLKFMIKIKNVKTCSA
jgi:hypothetical protein